MAATGVWGCSEGQPAETPGRDGTVEVTLRGGSVQITAPAGKTMQKSTAGRPATRTAAPMPVNCTFRMIVLETGAAVTTTPVAENTYRITDGDGNSTEAAADAGGHYDAALPAPPPSHLKQQNYDFYFFSPALAFSGGKFTGLVNGADYMAGRQSYSVYPNHADGRFHVPIVQLARLSSRIDIRISPKAGAFIATLAPGHTAGYIKGLPGSATYTPGDTALVTSGTTGEVAIPPHLFTPTGNGASSVLSTGEGTGVVVLPGQKLILTLRLPLLINGTFRMMEMRLFSVTLSPGYKHLLDLTIDHTGNAALTIGTEVWTDGGSSSNDWEEVP